GDVCDAGVDDLGDVVVELDEQRVVGGVHHRLVQREVGLHEGTHVLVGAGLLTQCHGVVDGGQVLLAVAQGRQTRGLHLQCATHLEVLTQTRTLQTSTQGTPELAGGKHERPCALTDFQQTRVRERAHRFTNGVTAHSELFGQFRLGGDTIADTPFARVDLCAQLIDDLVHQTGSACRGEGHACYLLRDESPGGEAGARCTECSGRSLGWLWRGNGLERYCVMLMMYIGSSYEYASCLI